MFSLAVVLLITAGAYAQPRYVTINSNPLQMNVASDGSMQIYNAAVPGTGQIYPSGNEFGDFGIFARIDGTLYAPNFAQHGGTATSGLGTYTPWATTSLSTVTGEGSPASPYSVTVALTAPGTDVTLNVTITHVRGNNFFRMRSRFAATAPHELDAYIGADIYLAGSDAGQFISVPELNAVGGRNCDGTEGSYNILLIPITPAHRFTASGYSDVWRQIGAGDLDSDSEELGCIDNGAAVQWENLFNGDTRSAELLTAVSFGEIPSAANFHGFFVDVTPREMAMVPGESRKLTIHTQHNDEIGFNAPITFSVVELPAGMTLTFDNDTIPAPGTGTTTATLTLGDNVFPMLYQSIGFVASGGNEVHGGFFTVDVLCTPPFILSLPSSQPLTQSVPRGTRAKLTVKPEPGSGGLSYQWYNGFAPLSGSPIAGANAATLDTPPVTETQQYWVRVSNACGSANSMTATVTPSN